MKKLLTLCLALAMTLSVGAYALTTLGSPTAKAADETATETTSVSAPIDYANSTALQQDKFSRIQIWIDNGLRNRISNVEGTIKTTIKFVTPLSVDSFDYFDLKALIWGGNRSGLPFKVYALGGDKVNQTAYVFNYASTADPESYEGNLDMRIAAKGLENEKGLVEGFDFEISGIPAGSHLVFSDITAVHEKTPLAILDEKHTTTENNKWGFQTSNWAGVATKWDEYGVTYGGRDFVGSLYNIVLKYPVAAEKVKTIDFKAVLWNNAGVGRVQIAKLDGTNTEIINVNKGWTEVFEKNIDVKVNAELLADENGLVHGFRMNAINDDSGSFVFSKFTSGTEEKVYNATLTLGNGTQENIAYTASNRAAKLDKVKEKLGTNGVEYTYSNDVPAELPFEEGKTYTETRTLNKYTVTFKNYNGETLKTETVDYGATPVAPETPAKPYDDDNHYTFKSWDKEIATVTGDVTYTAEFNTVAHVYGEWTTTKAPTCTEKGSHKKVCECGKEITEDMPATGHTEVPDAAVAPTCTEPGKTEGSHCSVCGEVLTAQQTVNALGHDMGEFKQTTAPTCTAKGVKTATCKREGCNHTETQDMPAKGHTLEKVEKVAATESKEGVKEHYRCTECGDLFLDENGTTPATEDNLKIAKLQKKGCKGSVGGLGLALAAFGAAFVALKKKRG